MDFDRYQGRLGVWVLYYYDARPIADAIFARAVEAIAELRDSSATHIAFWPIGTTFEEAIKLWEGKNDD